MSTALKILPKCQLMSEGPENILGSAIKYIFVYISYGSIHLRRPTRNFNITLPTNTSLRDDIQAKPSFPNSTFPLKVPASMEPEDKAADLAQDMRSTGLNHIAFDIGPAIEAEGVDGMKGFLSELNRQVS